MDIINLLISLVSGLVGGNATGAVAKDTSLGVVGNSIAGLVGGGLGTYIAQATDILSHAQAAGNLDLTALLGTVGSGGIGGIVLTLIAGFIKKAMQKQ